VQPTRFELVIHLKTANALRLATPEGMLDHAEKERNYPTKNCHCEAPQATKQARPWGHHRLEIASPRVKPAGRNDGNCGSAVS
jgi:hypothetical protein